MNVVRGFVAVIVGLAITLVFVQLLESMLAMALAGQPAAVARRIRPS